MNFKRIFDLLIGLTFLGLLGSYIYNHSTSTTENKNALVKKQVKASDILKLKTTLSDSLINTTATSSACTLFLKHSAVLSMNDYANEFIDHHNDGIIKTCSGAFPTHFQKQLNIANTQCVNSTRAKIDKLCYAKLIEVKSAGISAIIKADANPHELSAPLLLHLLADKFLTRELALDPERNLNLVDALLEIEPNYFNAYKLKLLMIAANSTKENAHTLFQKTLEEVIQLTPQDPEIMEISKYSSDWVFDYYKAYMLYEKSSDNYQETLSLLENLQLKFPANKRSELTIANLKSDDQELKQHPFILNFEFNLDDL
jgi:hypothetical protein